MPFVLTYRSADGRRSTIRNITKLEGVWSKRGELAGYYLYEGNRPTDHRRLGFIDLGDVVSVDAHLPPPATTRRNGG